LLVARELIHVTGNKTPLRYLYEGDSFHLIYEMSNGEGRFGCYEDFELKIRMS